MPGETHLTTLLRTLQPQLHAAEYVFCTLPGMAQASALDPIALFRETEGITAIVERARAEAQGTAFIYPCRMITLTVHSSLEAVGMMAAITAALAAEGISVNPVSAYHHDHLFVPADKAAAAMDVLRAFAA